MTATLERERPGVLPGQVYSHWRLGGRGTAFVDSLSPALHVVFVRLPDPADTACWTAERLIPLFPGWDVSHTFCVDGWGLRFKGRPRAEVVARVGEVVAGRLFRAG